MTDAQDDERLGQLFESHGHRGVLTYWWILERIASRMDDSDRCNLETSRQHWAKMLRTYWKDAEKILTRCRDLGLILWTSSGDLVDISCPKLLEIRARKKPIGRKVCRADIDIEVDGRSRGKNKTITVKPLDDYSQEFLSFWKTYPRKIGKAEAWKAWKKAKVNGKAEEVLSAIQKQVEGKHFTSEKDGKDYIPNPSTWINQGRWEDEITKTALEKWAEE